MIDLNKIAKDDFDIVQAARALALHALLLHDAVERLQKRVAELEKTNAATKQPADLPKRLEDPAG